MLLDGARGAGLTFELSEQVVGWPYFTIEAPAGTVIELLVHEAHQVGGPPLLNTHFDSWTRFTCREGVNRFECFDFESLRWLQLHIHDARGVVTVRDVGVRRRQFPWPQEPRDPLLRARAAAALRRFDQHALQLRRKHWWMAWPASASNTAGTAGINCTPCTWSSAKPGSPRGSWRRGARG